MACCFRHSIFTGQSKSRVRQVLEDAPFRLGRHSLIDFLKSSKDSWRTNPCLASASFSARRVVAFGSFTSKGKPFCKATCL